MVRERQQRIAAGRDESGFGLVETIIALLIAGIVFGALATTLIASVQASLFGRQNQQATDFMTRQLEVLRGMEFGALAHTAADLTTDTSGRVSACGTVRCLDLNGADAGGLETLVTATNAGIPVHTTVLSGTETN